MDNSIANFELSSSTVQISSGSENGSDRGSDNFEELHAASNGENRELEQSPNVTGANELPPGEAFDNNLPETVTLLRTPSGVKVYLVGTAHFSRESQDDVAKVINAVLPHVVVVELCNARTSILSLDEATILEEAKNLDMEKVMSTIRSNGVYNGIMYLLLLNMSAHLTKEIGMAPGGEFRVAYKEAQRVGNCGIHLGDRPIQITLQRALARLTWWQTLKLGWHLLTSKDPISKEEIERCKRRDMLEQLLAEMAGEYPALGEVFVDERDIFLTHSLQAAANGKLHPKLYGANPNEPLRVVGVVGIGHVVGITRLWPVDQRSFLPNILVIPKQTLTSRIVKVSFKISLLAVGGYMVYRYVPVPSLLKQSCSSVLQKISTNVRVFRTPI